MKISFEKSLVSIGTKQYQVLKPIIDLSNLYVVQVQEHNHIIFGNEHSLEILANLLEYSSGNPNSIIYLNTKNSMLTEYLSECWSNIQKSFELVILHHSIQLKIHEWKQIRALRLKAMKRHTDTFIEFKNSTRNDSEYHYREHKDFLDINDRFETLFLVGSNRVFTDIALDTVSIRENGRELFLKFPGCHDHEHIDYYARKEYTKNYKYDGHFLCIDFYDRELWKR